MRIHSVIKWILAGAVILSLLPVSVRSWPRRAPTAQQAAIPQDDLKEFERRIQKYLDIQEKAVKSVPSIPKEVTDPDLIAKHQAQVAAAIRTLRPNAMPGEIFTPWLRRTIAAAVKEQVQGERGKDAKASILGEGNPKSPETPAPVNLKINSTYSTTAPLSTVPPSVLMALPTLPKEIEYRFVGRDLILRDTKANIVVDILTKAF